MKIAVITDDFLKEELIAQGIQEGTEAEWVTKPGVVEDASACIDLLFTPAAGRIAELQRVQTGIIIINAVSTTLTELPQNFIRINGWRGFLKSNIVEAACNNIEIRAHAEKIFTCFGKTVEWLPDKPGFVTARVVSTIINEAYLAFEEAVSSKEEIDIAMKMGTNYPYGPFEWGKTIGLKNVYDLLVRMARLNPRYTPSSLLQQEAING